ncbi:hypothetical protein [Egbenema bharatensis]|uniref:hypothetical protein n=1 Tax=Egbenema bharatensis TaxID=3463334 RepID=UPI003A859AB7
MDRRTSAPVADQRTAQATLGHCIEMAMNPFPPIEHSTEKVSTSDTCGTPEDLLLQATRLDNEAKINLIQALMTQVETEQLQMLLKAGQQELAGRQEQITRSKDRQTRLLLKKDYSYQDRGLSEPTQYYVYIRRRKPKLDRYIGTLFYVPQGCTLAYEPDAEGRILFQPPCNVFQLKDSKNPAAVQVVRLICLEPPPPDYTFTKQQNDTPEIYLRLEYLDPRTYQPIAEESYPFPFCMYEGGMLDRYRWDVSSMVLPDASNVPLIEPNRDQNRDQDSNPEQKRNLATDRHASQPATISPSDDKNRTPKPTANPPRQILELPTPASITCFLADQAVASQILERMRLWVTWSEKATPQSKWKIVQVDTDFVLINANFNRKILSFSLEQSAISLESSLPVLMKWFHDLSLAVTQAQNQRQYSSAQLKLAHKVFVEMSLPKDDPLIVLKVLFGVDFSKTSLYQ